jgi:hypothetical protein
MHDPTGTNCGEDVHSRTNAVCNKDETSDTAVRREIAARTTLA